MTKYRLDAVLSAIGLQQWLTASAMEDESSSGCFLATAKITCVTTGLAGHTSTAW